MEQSDNQYFKDFWEESDKLKSQYIIKDKRGNTHIFDKDQVLQEILALPSSTKKTIRKKFVQIDFNNGNINHFINYILKGLVN